MQLANSKVCISSLSAHFSRDMPVGVIRLSYSGPCDWPIQGLACKYLCVTGTAGKLEDIEGVGPIHNIGQSEGMREEYYASLRAKLSVSGADSQFTTLANAKACAKFITGPCGPTLSLSEAHSYFIILANANACAKHIIGPGGPTRAYREQTANLERWSMRRPALNLLQASVGQAEYIGSIQTFYNIGQYEGIGSRLSIYNMHEKYYGSTRSNLSVSEADSQFMTMANAKACAKFITDPGGPTLAYRTQTAIL